MKVICIDISKGKTHDFNLFKKSKLRFLESIKLFADSGYQGICNYHSNSEIPIKSSKNHKLSDEDKEYNHNISKKRIYIEHINCYIKRFKILSSRYRNKRKKLGLRVALICGIYNFQN
jgi:hypothetical protein